ncbi:MAG: inositol monophosphatase family protein [Pseudomonadota bacterium]
MSFSDQELEDLERFALRLAGAARAETLPRFRAGAAIDNKEAADFDPVTDADREAERAIINMVAATYPDHGVLGEEFGVSGGAGPARWIVDPVDGTRAFVCGVATWTTLIALERDGAQVLGLIDQPYTDDCWIALRGETRFRRGDQFRRARVSGETKLANARISTTDPRVEGYMSEAEAAGFARLAGASRLARFSMDAYAYGLLALGELDVVAETSLQLHDYAALKPVVEGAGGVVTNWRGDPLGADDRGEILAAASPALHEAALKALAG